MICINIEETGKTIKSTMKSSGITAKEVQEACGLASPRTIYKWYRGDRLPMLENLATVAALCGVTMDDLVVIERI